MFINFWYPVEESKSLGKDPVKVKILGQDFVAFRDASGTARVLSNICIHRGGSLGEGMVREGCVQCPYHGWLFNGDGQCTRIPSLGREAKPPARARVDAYPTQERYGIVFAFLGDLPEAERPPLMEIPEWGQKGWRETNINYVWKANYKRAVENALDIAHPEFVHRFGSKGENPEYKVPDYDVEHHDWGAGTMVTYHPPAPKGFWRILRSGSRSVTAGTTFHGVNQFITYIQISKNASAYQYVYECPVDEYTTRTFLVNLRSFLTLPIFDKSSNGRNFGVAEEDRVIVEKVEPCFNPESQTDDLSVKADALSVAYRRCLKDWEAKGWRIDAETLAQEYKGKHAYTIPSPARREHKGWVLDTVPMKTPKPKEAPFDVAAE